MWKMELEECFMVTIFNLLRTFWNLKLVENFKVSLFNFGMIWKMKLVVKYDFFSFNLFSRFIKKIFFVKY